TFLPKMTSNAQLRAPQKNGDAPDLRKLSRPQLEQAFTQACKLLAAAADRFSTPIVLDGAGTRNVLFCEIERRILKMEVETLSPRVRFDLMKYEVTYSPPAVRASVHAALEGDLLDAQRVVKSGHDQVQIRKWIGKLRQADEVQARAPIEIKVLNASEIGSVDKVLTVKRDSDGKLSGAVLQPVT